MIELLMMMMLVVVKVLFLMFDFEYLLVFAVFVLIHLQVSFQVFHLLNN
jgi:hypothetical protein